MSKDNKGFSLVELIVVVLIMAILAVSLAPQVTKWVENAKLANDVSNYNQMFANVQVALTDGAAYELVTTESIDDFVIVIDTDGAKLMKGSDELDSGNALYDAIAIADISWLSCKKRIDEGDPYEIKIEHGTARIDAVPGKYPEATGTPWDG